MYHIPSLLIPSGIIITLFSIILNHQLSLSATSYLLQSYTLTAAPRHYALFPLSPFPLPSAFDHPSSFILHPRWSSFSHPRSFDRWHCWNYGGDKRHDCEGCHSCEPVTAIALNHVCFLYFVFFIFYYFSLSWFFSPSLRSLAWLFSPRSHTWMCATTSHDGPEVQAESWSRWSGKYAKYWMCSVSLCISQDIYLPNSALKSRWKSRWWCLTSCIFHTSGFSRTRYLIHCLH